MSKERYTYEETKNRMGEVRDFFEKIDTSKLSGQDNIKLDVLKDMWADYYHNFVQYDCYSKERTKQSVTLFVMACSISDKEVKTKVIDFTYSFMAGLNDELFSISEYENLNEMLKSVELVPVPNYFEVQKELKNLACSNNITFSITEYQKAYQMLLEAGKISAGKPIKFILKNIESDNENKD